MKACLFGNYRVQITNVSETEKEKQKSHFYHMVKMTDCLQKSALGFYLHV